VETAVLAFSSNIGSEVTQRHEKHDCIMGLPLIFFVSKIVSNFTVIFFFVNSLVKKTVSRQSLAVADMT
jgi:hypothetical protein